MLALRQATQSCSRSTLPLVNVSEGGWLCSYDGNPKSPDDAVTYLGGLLEDAEVLHSRATAAGRRCRRRPPLRCCLGSSKRSQGYARRLLFRACLASRLPIGYAVAGPHTEAVRLVVGAAAATRTAQPRRRRCWTNGMRRWSKKR